MTYTLVTLLNEEEEIAFQQMKTAALKKCDHRVAEFMACSSRRTFSGFVICRPMLRAMNECLAQHTTEDIRDSFRTELYAKKEEKMRLAAVAASSASS